MCWKLTTVGQYPNSSRNSSGFRTTDSDHILSAATTFPSSTSSAPTRRRRKKKSRKFLFECSGHHVHYALVTTAASCRRGGHIHPLLPVTHAIWTAGRNLVTARRKKVCGHASCEKPSCGLVKGILVHGYDIIQTSLLTFNELVCEKEPPAAVR